MITQLNFICSPEEAKDLVFLELRIRKELRIKPAQKIDFRWRKRSIDARQKQIKVNASFDVAIDALLPPRFATQVFSKLAANAAEVHIIGAGDTVIATTCLCLICGASPTQIAALANLAGGLVCESPGVVSINKDKLLKEALQLIS